MQGRRRLPKPQGLACRKDEDVIGALMEELERAHPGESLLDHVLTIRSQPTEGEPDDTAIIR
jgi:hypothetical protein